jgi:hypothetical protein
MVTLLQLIVALSSVVSLRYLAESVAEEVQSHLRSQNVARHDVQIQDFRVNMNKQPSHASSSGQDVDKTLFALKATSIEFAETEH